MNRIVTLQRTLRERGRLRIGTSSLNARGKKVPKKLDRFLFSAPDEATVTQAAGLFGGTPEPWDGGGRDRFRVISNVDSLAVVFPAAMGFSQAYETWANGFCTRRCDTVTAWVPGVKRMVEEPCSCNPDERDCKVTTNLAVILPDLPGLGTWRLVSHGYYAATELAGAVELIESAMAAGMRVPARLFLEQREVRRLIDGKPEVRKFVVPCLDLDVSVTALGNPVGGALPGAPQRSLDAPEAPSGAAGGALGTGTGNGWRPVDRAALPAAPPVSVADHLADNDRPVKPRRNAAPAIPRTGRAPRPAAAVDAGVCDLCGAEYGSDAVVKNPVANGSKYVHRTCRDDAERPAEEDVRDPAASQGQEVGDRDGTSGDGGTVAEPVPVASAPSSPGHVRMMTHRQHGTVMKLAAEAFPAAEGQTGPDADAMRRAAVVGICAVLGQPIKSRADITAATATPLIDALKAIKDGTLTWNGENLLRGTGDDAVGWEGAP